MKETKQASAITNEDLEEIYKNLTPENKVKFINKYYELLREQEQEK